MGHRTKKMPSQTGWRKPSRAHKLKQHNIKVERKKQQERREAFSWMRGQNRLAREDGDPQ